MKFVYLMILMSFLTVNNQVSAQHIGDDTVSWMNNTATIYPVDAEDGLKRYYLKTTLPLRDNLPPEKEIEVCELPGQLMIRTGNSMFDGLFAMTIDEVRQDSVSFIHDWAFPSERCECFETGEKWKYVWTRDTAYSVDLSLGMIDPTRAKNSLEFKLSPRRTGGQYEIVQDTGTGGSWPVSTDRVVWAMGAWETLKYLDGQEREDFLNLSYQAIVNTIENDRFVVFDDRDGLYRGEQSFLDWREQTYPMWTANQNVYIGMSKALSTNVNHYMILFVASKLAMEKGDATSYVKYKRMAEELKDSINKQLWLPKVGLYSTMTATELDGTPLKKFDLLGEALSVLTNVASSKQAESIVANYPHTISGPPVIWPQQPDVPVYHNRGIWPFVTAYMLKAAKKVKNDAVVNHNVFSMIAGAALNLSNMENFEFLTLSNWYGDGNLSGPVVNSRRQLWSVAGYASMVMDIVFGKEATQEGIRFKPFITTEVRNKIFEKSDSIELKNVPYKGKLINVTVNLPAAEYKSKGYLEVAKTLMNGKAVKVDTWFSKDDLLDTNELVVTLRGVAKADSSVINIPRVVDVNNLQKTEREMLWAPREPVISNFTKVKGSLGLKFDSNGEKDVVFNVYKNGKRVASNLNVPYWLDENFSIYETSCYAVESQFLSSGNTSHHSQPRCYWAYGTVQEFYVGNNKLVSLQDHAIAYDHGRVHFANWGYPHESIQISKFVPKNSGDHFIQLVYGNTFGPINSGITAATKLIEIIDMATRKVVDKGTVFMPHLINWDTWGDSSLFATKLDKDKVYKIIVKDYYNMSYFSHFEGYVGTGGYSGATNRVNLAGVKVFQQ